MIEPLLHVPGQANTKIHHGMVHKHVHNGVHVKNHAEELTHMKSL